MDAGATRRYTPSSFQCRRNCCKRAWRRRHGCTARHTTSVRSFGSAARRIEPLLVPLLSHLNFLCVPHLFLRDSLPLPRLVLLEQLDAVADPLLRREQRARVDDAEEVHDAPAVCLLRVARRGQVVDHGGRGGRRGQWCDARHGDGGRVGATRGVRRQSVAGCLFLRAFSWRWLAGSAAAQQQQRHISNRRRADQANSLHRLSRSGMRTLEGGIAVGQ